MSNIVQVDHIVIMVEELAAAMRDYTTLGFNIIEGGVHSDNPTHNALIIFEDGAYIEVIALRDKTATEMSPRTIRWNRAKPGLVDFALLPRNIDQDVVEIRRRGVSVEDPQPGGRTTSNWPPPSGATGRGRSASLASTNPRPTR
jgi:hypothetical protein